MTDNTQVIYEIPHQGYPCLDVVVELVWPDVPEVYAGNNVATGKATHVRHMKGDEPD